MQLCSLDLRGCVHISGRLIADIFCDCPFLSSLSIDASHMTPTLMNCLITRASSLHSLEVSPYSNTVDLSMIHKWKELLESAVRLKSLAFGGLNLSDALYAAVQCCTILDSLYVSNMRLHIDIFHALCENCVYLRSLHLSSCFGGCSELWRVLRHCNALETLHINDCGYVNIIPLNDCHQADRLETLMIHDCQLITPMDSLALVCPNLHVLELSGTKLSLETFTAMSFLTQLRSLTLSCTNINNAQLRQISMQCTMLSTLTLQSCEDISESALSVIASYLPHLKSVNVSQVQRISNEDILSLIQRAIELEVSGYLF